MEETWTKADIKKYEGMLKRPEIFYLETDWVVFFTTIYADHGFLVTSKRDKSPLKFKTLDDAAKFLHANGFESVAVNLAEFPHKDVAKKSKQPKS